MPPRAARAVLAEVRNGTRCGVHLAIYGGQRIHIVDPDPDNPPSHPGLFARYPQAVALGKVAMAELPEWESMLPGGRLHSATEHTLATRVRVEQELRTVAHQGWPRQTDELVVGRSCLAMPIRDESGRLVAGIAASGSSQSWQERQPGLLALLSDAGRRLAPLIA